MGKIGFTMNNKLFCWVCDNPIDDGDSVFASLHPDDDGVSKEAKVMVWHKHHPSPSEAGDEIKSIVMNYGEIIGYEEVEDDD